MLSYGWLQNCIQGSWKQLIGHPTAKALQGYSWLVCYVFTVALICPFNVYAQQANPAADAAKEHEKRLQQEELRRQEQLDSQRAISDVFLQPATESDKTTDTLDATCFDIKTINVTGVVSVDKLVIDGIADAYRNQCLGLARINQLIKDISNLYLAKGLVTSRAFLQPQNLADGVLEIWVVEGTLENVESANGSLSERQLQWAFPVEEGKVLNLRDLEQGLEQLNRLQQNKGELDIQPGSQTGRSRVIIRNPELSAWHFGGGLNNSGSKATGELLATAYLSWDNPANVNDNLYLSVSDAIDHDEYAKSKSYAVAYSLPLGYGLYSYSSSYFEYQQLVKGDAVDFITSGNSYNQSFTADYTVWRSQQAKLAVSSSLTRKQSRNYLADVFLDTSSRVLYIVDAGATYTRPLAQGIFRTTFQWYRSVDWFDAKTEIVTAENDYQFNKYTLDISLNTTFALFNKQFSYLSSAYLLYSPKVIIASEALSLGGRYSVRGIEGEGLTGYKGGYWRNEVGYATALLGGRLNTFLGVDVGQSDTPEIPDSNAEWLAGSVAGFRFSTQRISMDITYAQALHVPEFLRGDTHGLYAALQCNF